MTENQEDDVLMKYESWRLKTFSNWDGPVDSARLARSGFFYSGIDDKVICFSCNGHLKDWKFADIVQKRHAEKFPNCDFINNISENVPINHNIKREKVAREKQGFEKYCDVFTNLNLNTEDDELNNSSALKYSEYKEPAHNPGDICNKATTKTLDKYNKPDEILNGLPNKSGQPPAIVTSPLKNSLPPSKSKLIHQQKEHLKKLGVHLHSGPTSPPYASLKSRIQSYTSWPDDIPVSIEDLAKAGLYYLGVWDHTKCFHCDGGLCNWEEGDDPWIEHARFFPNCGFILLKKGMEFVEDCQKTESVAQLPNIIVKSLMSKVDKAMTSDIVKNVLKTSKFPPYIVHAAVLRQIKNTGSSFSTMDDLCIAVRAELEKNPVKLKNPLSDVSSPKKVNDCNNQEREKIMSNLMDISPDAIPKQSINICNSTEEGSLVNDKLCIVCMEEKVNVVFLPCGHLLACTECALSLKLCPLCRQTIQATVRAYLP